MIRNEFSLKMSENALLNILFTLSGNQSLLAKKVVGGDVMM